MEEVSLRPRGKLSSGQKWLLASSATIEDVAKTRAKIDNRRHIRSSRFLLIPATSVKKRKKVMKVIVSFAPAAPSINAIYPFVATHDSHSPANEVY